MVTFFSSHTPEPYESRIDGMMGGTCATVLLSAISRLHHVIVQEGRWDFWAMSYEESALA